MHQAASLTQFQGILKCKKTEICVLREETSVESLGELRWAVNGIKEWFSSLLLICPGHVKSKVIIIYAVSFTILGTVGHNGIVFIINIERANIL